MALQGKKTNELNIIFPQTGITRQVMREINDCLRQPGQEITLDLGQMVELNSARIGRLLRVHKKAAQKGKHILLTNVPPRIRILLELTGSDKLFQPKTPNPRLAA